MKTLNKNVASLLITATTITATTITATTLWSLGTIDQKAMAQSNQPGQRSIVAASRLNPPPLSSMSLGQKLLGQRILSQTTSGIGVQTFTNVPEDEITRFGTILIFTGFVAWVISLCNKK